MSARRSVRLLASPTLEVWDALAQPHSADPVPMNTPA